MSYSIYGKDYIKVNDREQALELVKKVSDYYLAMVNFKGVKSGSFSEVLVKHNGGDWTDLIEDRYLTDSDDSSETAKQLEELFKQDRFELMIEYSLDAQLPTVPNNEFFMDLLDEKYLGAIEYKGLSYSDEDDEVWLYEFNEKHVGEIEMEEGFFGVAGITEWKTNNYFLSIEAMPKSFYDLHQMALDDLLKRIADIHENSYERICEDDEIDLQISGAAKFCIHRIPEYKELLQDLYKITQMSGCEITLVENFFSYEFARLSISFEEGIFETYSGF